MWNRARSCVLLGEYLFLKSRGLLNKALNVALDGGDAEEAGAAAAAFFLKGDAGDFASFGEVIELAASDAEHGGCRFLAQIARREIDDRILRVDLFRIGSARKRKGES